MSFDLTEYFRPDSVALPSDAPDTIVARREHYNKRTKAWEQHLGTNSGLGVSRFDTSTGAAAGRICYVDMSRSKSEIHQQIIQLYYDFHFTQQELADATGYSQSTISRIINEK